MANGVRTARVYQFGAFTIDARTGELSHAGRRTPLRDQSVQLLLALLEQPGELITREELAGRLWAEGTFVDFDRGLNKAINHLREALEDSAEEPRFIETLPRKGYRFIAPVTCAGEDVETAPLADTPRASSLRRWLLLSVVVTAAIGMAIGSGIGGVRKPAATVSPQIAALAVLPLENLSHDPEQQYFADGLTDALITDLAKIGSTRITSRTSVMHYRATKKNIKDIGRELNVDAVVEGTVMYAGERVRVTAQLIQVSTDMHLWSEAYEREVSSILDLQRTLATDIARRINVFVKPLDRTRVVNPEAYGLYLKARYAFYTYTSQGWQQAIEHFNKAIERDPEFAPAYSGLSDTYLVAGAYSAVPTEEALTRGKAAAARALQLDETLASAHYAMATAHTWYDWDWAGADREFRRGLELNPNDALGRNWHGGYLSLLGRHDEAIAEHQRAEQLDPLSVIGNANVARALYRARRYDEAIAQARKTLELDPNFSVALLWLEGSLRHKGLFNDAVALRQSVAAPDQVPIIARTFQRDGFQALLRQSGEAFKKSGALVTAARYYAQSGDKDKAIALLETCAQRRCSDLVSLNVEPDFDGLRTEPRFQTLLRQIGLP
ncbi:MAG TPA: winged helix-turn-helix domain-containing protein [Vicinamibacterales bacterium]|jgi:TolB-like protein/DNA-binding winged helix-turn-helix (wHTH) protein